MEPDCGRSPADVSGACRNRLLKPDRFVCGRCVGVELPERPRPPAATAKRDEWAAWAIACGADEAYAHSRSRSELIEEFGKRIPTADPAVDSPGAE